MQQFFSKDTISLFLLPPPPLLNTSVPEPTPSTMTALHQFGAEMLKLSKRLESYPMAAASAPRPPIPPSPLLFSSHHHQHHNGNNSTKNISIVGTTNRLIRSTTNASIVDQRANSGCEVVVGDDTTVHYHTDGAAPAAAVGGDSCCNHHHQHHHCRRDDNVDYPLPELSGVAPTSETISVEQHRYISGTCKQSPPPLEDHKPFMTFPRISINDPVR